MNESRTTTRVTRAAKGIQRRVFLRAAALGMAAPAALQLSRMAVAAPSGPSKRLLVFHMPHGVPNIHYNPKLIGADPTQFVLNDSFVSILGPLEPYKKYVNVYQGFKYNAGGGPHENAVNFLTDSKDVTGNPARTSIDYAIGQRLDIKPVNLGASARPLGGVSLCSKVFWDGTNFVEPEKNPVKAADRLFGGIQGGGAPAVDPEADARKAALEFTAAEVESLQKELAALTSEQSKLSAHLKGLNALRAGSAGGGVTNCASKPTLTNVEKVRALNMPDVTPSGTANWYLGGYQGENPNMPLILAAQMEVAANALICNAAPIITLQSMFSTSECNFEFMGVNKAHHSGISHNGPESNLAAPASAPVTDFAKAQRWFTEQIVKGLVEPLLVDDPSNPGTKVIDNTIIYVCSEIGDGNYHTLATQDYPAYHPNQPFTSFYLPLLTIGGGGGALKTGRVYRTPSPVDGPPVDRPAADIYVTLAQAMGAGIPQFGDSTAVISEVLA